MKIKDKTDLAVFLRFDPTWHNFNRWLQQHQDIPRNADGSYDSEAVVQYLIDKHGMS